MIWSEALENKGVRLSLKGGVASPIGQLSAAKSLLADKFGER